jgi:hypothetical protein
MRRAMLFQVGLIASVFAAIPGFALVARAVGPDSPLWEHEPMRSFGERLGIVRPMIMGDIVDTATPAGNPGPGSSGGGS